MTDKKMAQKAFEEVERELEGKQIAELKKIVKKTLTKLEVKKDEKEKIDKEIKILKSDIDDLKEGRLDRIKERQEKDPEAKRVSVIIIKEKVVEREVPVWKQPYTWYYNNNTTGAWDNMPLATTTYGTNTLNCNSNTLTNNTGAIHYMTCNVAKYNTKGTYKVDDDVVYLR